MVRLSLVTHKSIPRAPASSSSSALAPGLCGLQYTWKACAEMRRMREPRRVALQPGGGTAILRRANSLRRNRGQFPAPERLPLLPPESLLPLDPLPEADAVARLEQDMADTDVQGV